MCLIIAYSKIKKQNLVLTNNDTHQRETLSEQPIRLPLKPYREWVYPNNWLFLTGPCKL